MGTAILRSVVSSRIYYMLVIYSLHHPIKQENWDGCNNRINSILGNACDAMYTIRAAKRKRENNRKRYNYWCIYWSRLNHHSFLLILLHLRQTHCQ